MAITNFICPNGDSVSISKCLKSCKHKNRCMFLPTLKTIASTLQKEDTNKASNFKPTIGELISGNLEIYLKKNISYAINPAEVLINLQKTTMNGLTNYSEGTIIKDTKLSDDIVTTNLSVYGKILDKEKGILGDTKIVSAYKLFRALGYYKADVPIEGEFYKSGVRKGQQKTKKELFKDGVKDIFEWALQMNYQRMLLEKDGFKVNKMIIQVFCRDYNTKMAQDLGITNPVYIIKVNKISNYWLKLYFRTKYERLKKALETKIPSKVCNFRERWGNRKCQDYCDVKEHCPYRNQFITENPSE